MSGTMGNETMLDMYLFETNQLLIKLEQLVMESEDAEGFRNTIDEIFRHMHTIKGNSMMMLFESIAEVAHSIEDLYDYLRKNEGLDVDYTKTTDLVLESLDFIRGEIEKIKQGQDADGNGDVLKAHINQMLASLKFMNSDEGENKSVEEEQAHDEDEQKYFIPPKGVTASAKENDINKNLFSVDIWFDDDCQMHSVRAFSVVNNLQDYYNDILYFPKGIMEEDHDKEIKENGFHVMVDVEKEDHILKEIIENLPLIKKFEISALPEDNYLEYRELFLGVGSDDADYTIGQGSAVDGMISDLKGTVTTSENFEAIKELNPTKGLDPIGEFIPIENIETDALIIELPEKKSVKKEMTSENEKKVAKSTSGEGNDKPTDNGEKPSEAGKLASKLKTKEEYINVSIGKIDELLDIVGELVVSESMVTRNPDLKDLELDNFSKAVRQHRFIINELQDLVMSIRMVPLSLTFQKMNRVVRDMKKKMKKDVELTIIGETTEVDKNVIEHIGDPLMHIIRNSIDHGIESPAEREAVGKDRTGQIILEAKHSGNEVWIRVKDDGKGINRDSILDKAEHQNMLRKDREEYTDKEVFALLYQPGFSTKESITEFSGRGVGLDVVTKNIQELGGNVSIDSEEGKGTEFSIKIPLTLAIIEGMLIKVGENSLTLPIISIKESFSVSKDDVVVDPDGNQMIMLRDQCYPVLKLYERYNFKSEITDFENGIMLMIESEENSICIFADEIVDEQQVVVKNLPKYLDDIWGISGCTLLADGKISLIVDPSEIVGMYY